MASEIPYCGICKQKRDEELEMAKGMKEARRREKGKGKAKDWGGTESDEEVDEWGGGLPGIMKVSYRRDWYVKLTTSPTSPSLARLLTPNSMNVSSGTEKRWTCW